MARLATDLAAVLSLTSLSPFTASRYAALTSEAHRSAIETGEVIGIGASAAGEPVGLALGCPSTAGLARILSVYVVPAFRNQGLGARLLSQLEGDLATQGQDHAEVIYTLATDGTPALEGLLRKCKWPAEGQRLHVFALDGRIMAARWFDTAVLPPPYAIASWSTLSSEERHALAQAPQTAWCPEFLLPFRFEHDLEPLNSLVLRHDGVVAGWLLTRRFDATTIHYANLYVRPSLNRVGNTFATLALLAEAVRRQERALGVTSSGRFEVRSDNAALLRFIERHLRNFVVSRTTMQRLIKSFRPSERDGVLETEPERG